MGPRWRLIRSRELLSKETFQQHEVKMSYNLPLDFQWNMEVQIPVHLHKKKQVKYLVFFLTFLFSLSIMSNSSRCHGLQHARLPCPSPSPRVCSQSCPLSRWCHPAISSSVIPFSFCLQSFPAFGKGLLKRVCSNESALCIRWPKYRSFSFNISPSSEHPELISFRIDWLDLLAVQPRVITCIQVSAAIFPPKVYLEIEVT